MAVFGASSLQSKFSNRSVLSFPATGDSFGQDDLGMASSPCPLSCSTAKQSCYLYPEHVSRLTLRPAPCDPKSTTYQNGQITPTSPQLSVVKADTTPFPPPLPNAWTWSPENSSALASIPPTRSDEGPSNWYGSTLLSPKELLRRQRRHSIHSKPLLSPIKFSPDVEARATDQIGELPHPDHFSDVENQVPQDDVNSFHSSDWDLAAPSRRLSYGEPLDMVDARSVRKSTGSTKFPSKAGWLVGDKNYDTWIDDTLKAQANRPYHSEPSRRKNRLWLDLVEDDEEITEAVSDLEFIRRQMLRCVQHATAVTTSPSKPRVISIPPRRVDAESSHGGSLSLSMSNFQPGVSTFLPETPPQSPIPSIETPQPPAAPLNGFAIDAVDTNKQARQHQAFNRIRSRTTWSTTPPSSTVATLWASETVRQDAPPSPILPTFPTISRPATPPPMPVRSDLKLSELTTWIVTELETAMTGDISQTLQLDTPVIQQLRLPPKQRKIPRQTPLNPARSSFSAIQGPLSSHSSPSNFAEPPHENSEWPSLATKHMSAAPNAALSILDRIFPLAPRPNLSHLLTTIVAHQFICTLQTPLVQQIAATKTSPFAARHSRKTFPPTATASHMDGLPEHIPSKARAMLGLPPPSSPKKPRDGRPPLPSFWRKVEKMEWKDRIGKLEAELRRSVRRLVRELVGGNEWKSGERWLDALVSAVGEAVMMEEGTRATL